ncbi:PREDICTED: INO80 complex subunit B [Gekko japonicus]|uniref:INO80 complex subunit B n=1 Tax=Gekko japonicus TaxID=146911 RepID=A0ABM1KHA1_GEKJA|nr:PREDICTED: INO80 complex subunit B [Gekko japonicus]
MSKAWRRVEAGGGSGGLRMEGAGRGEDDESNGHGSHKKKHKKHKKKHKKKHHREDIGGTAGDVGPALPKPQLKLKIKLGGQILGTKRYSKGIYEDSNLEPSPLPELDAEIGFPAREEEEEQRWLDALERGELDDNGELKKEVDESLLTARQKALLHKQQSQPLLELPMGYKAKELTEEMLVKREERARKRRLQAAKKAEESKNQTIERLTKTSKAKVKTLRERKAKGGAVPTVCYRSAARGVTVSFPPGAALPLLPSVAPAPPPPTPCGVSGCPNLKRYSCSRTGVPLCSLACYRKNLLLQQAAA